MEYMESKMQDLYDAGEAKMEYLSEIVEEVKKFCKKSEIDIHDIQEALNFFTKMGWSLNEKKGFDTRVKPKCYCKIHNQGYHEYLDECPICRGEQMSESKEQIKVVQWAKRQRETCPDIRWLHHIPNGGLRNKSVAAKLKLEGVESGVFDLFLPVQRWKKNGLYIEMKVGKNKLTDKQIEFKKFVISQNYATAICYNAEEGIKILKKYLGIK